MRGGGGGGGGAGPVRSRFTILNAGGQCLALMLKVLTIWCEGVWPIKMNYLEDDQYTAAQLSFLL